MLPWGSMKQKCASHEVMKQKHGSHEAEAWFPEKQQGDHQDFMFDGSNVPIRCLHIDSPILSHVPIVSFAEQTMQSSVHIAMM